LFVMIKNPIIFDNRIQPYNQTIQIRAKCDAD
jgi:hypothetical protein